MSDRLRSLRFRGWLLLPLALAVGCRGPGNAQPTQLDQGMVVCEHPLAAEVGVRVLERGGNAADAAVATAFALAVCYPQAGNLGGGGLALWVPARGNPRALDFREQAPHGAYSGVYYDAHGRAVPEALREGAFSVAVPGSPAGLYALYRGQGSGRLSFEELVRPAVKLARRGFAVDAHLAYTLSRPAIRARLEASPGARELFYPGGEPLAQGELLVQPELADTLERLGRRGPNGFYTGRVAEAIVAELQASQAQPEAPAFEGPWISGADLEGYSVAWREPLRGWFRGQEVIAMPPPSSGGIVLLQVLAVLDGFPLDSERARGLARGADIAQDVTPEGLGPRTVHWWIEALRAAFAERARHLGDPDFTAVPVEDLLSAEWVARCRMSIGEETHLEDVPPPQPEGANTTHLSVVDRAGNAVSLTTTLNSSFGSALLVRGAGFLLNNEMDDFSLGGEAANQFGLRGGEANSIRPGKRPLSSMTPTVLREGGHRVSLVLGSPGGPRIITAVIAVILRRLVFQQTLEDAVAAPRFHQQWSPPETYVEPGWPKPLLEELERRGHRIVAEDERWASVQAIEVRRGGEVTGVSDPRRGGVAVGTKR